MEGDREGGVNLPQALVAEDMHFHLIVVDWRETKRAYINSNTNKQIELQCGLGWKGP